jgi:putative glutamine amidotransferase
MSSRKPIVGVPCDRRVVGDYYWHLVREEYLRAVIDGADCAPVLIPAFGNLYDVADLLDRFDGLLLTGSLSNVEPHHYEGPVSDPGTLHDPARDSTTLPLIPAAIELGVPVFGICRGFQEMNVALGGTLHQKIHEIDGYSDHRADESGGVERRFDLAHDIDLESGGLLRQLIGQGRVRVNSLHGQGIDRLAPNVTVEARAPDGVIEAFRVPKARSFALAVQWHPEWQVMVNPASVAMFKAFGEAARQRAKERAERRVR